MWAGLGVHDGSELVFTISRIRSYRIIYRVLLYPGIFNSISLAKYAVAFLTGHAPGLPWPVLFSDALLHRKYVHPFVFCSVFLCLDEYICLSRYVRMLTFTSSSLATTETDFSDSIANCTADSLNSGV